MSCGNHHEVDCATILDRLYEYIDHEMGDDDCTVVRRHLDECSPCLRKHDLEREVKALVQRACGCEPVPDTLRAKVLLRIREIRVELRSTAAPVGAAGGAVGGGPAIGHPAGEDAMPAESRTSREADPLV